MDTKEIAMQIVLKMLETNVLFFEGTSKNFTQEQAKKYNQECVDTVCNAYKTVYQTVSKEQNS